MFSKGYGHKYEKQNNVKYIFADFLLIFNYLQRILYIFAD